MLLESDGNGQRKIRLSGGTMNEKNAGSAKLGGYKERAKKETNGAGEAPFVGKKGWEMIFSIK